MKYIGQFTIIITISLMGEILNKLIPLPIPASIYGMIILFTLLSTKLLKLSAVKETGKFLIYIMPIMFVPPTVGLMDSWGIMQEFLIAIITISLLSTIIVLAVSGRITQFIIGLKEKGGDNNAAS
ncbi:MAG: CidA/LrgA family protein [Bacteroidaceae bacterium]|nr:CidA/LrgA family protein [Bacteroidaceae bacterium]